MLYFVALPLLARRIITGLLRDAGITQASFTLGSVSPFGLQARQVVLGESQSMRADTVHVSFSPRSLWRGRLKNVDIHGARINAKVDAEGRFDVGIPLSFGGSGATTLPLDRVDVRDSTGTIDWNGKHIDFPFTASIAQDMKNGIRVEAQVAAASVPSSRGEFRLKGFVAKASFDMDSTPARILEISVAVDKAMLDAPTELIGLLGVRATIPFGTSDHFAKPNTFEVDHVEFRGEQFPGPAGLMAIDDRTLNVTSHWPPLEGVEMNAIARLTLGDDGLTGELQAHVHAFAFEPLLRMADADGRLKGTEIAGSCEINAEIRLTAGIVTPSIDISLRDVKVHDPESTAQIDSASADITIDGFSPLSTPPNQKVTIERGSYGKLNLSDANIMFDLVDRDHLAIQSASWSLGDMGRFEASPFELDFTKPVIRTTLTGKAIQLKPWLSLLTSDRVRGEGELEGLLAIKIRPTSKFAIELGEGVLEATAANGYIQIRDQETVNNLVSRMDLGGDDTLLQVRDRIVAAVQDFNFTAFSVEFMPENDEVNCRIETKGIGRVGQNPQEIGGAVVNIHHFDDILRAVIRGKSLYDQVE